MSNFLILSYSTVGAVFTLRCSVVGSHKQLLESNCAQHTKPSVPVSRTSALSHYMLSAQATSTGTPRPRRR